MNSTYYFGIIVRLFSIALFIYGVGKLEFVVNFTYDERRIGPSLLYSISSSILPVLISIILWFFPLTVAGKILPTTSNSPTSINPHSFLTVLILAIGTYTFYYAVVDSLFWITYVHVFVTDEFGRIQDVLSNENKSNIVVTVMELILALVLLARAKAISNFMINFTR